MSNIIDIKGASNVALIKRFFPNVTMAEMKALTPADREELGSLIRVELAKA